MKFQWKNKIIEYQIKQDCFQSGKKGIVKLFKKGVAIVLFSVVIVFFVPLYILNMVFGVDMDPIINKMEELYPNMFMDGVEE